MATRCRIITMFITLLPYHDNNASNITIWQVIKNPVNNHLPTRCRKIDSFYCLLIRCQKKHHIYYQLLCLDDYVPIMFSIWQVIKNPVNNHLPTGCRKVTMSFQGDGVVNPKSLIPEDEPLVLVIGAMAHGSVSDLVFMWPSLYVTSFLWVL